MSASWPNSAPFASMPFASGFTIMVRLVSGTNLAECWVTAMGYLGLAFSTTPASGGFLAYRMGTAAPVDVTSVPMPDFVLSDISLVDQGGGTFLCVVKGFPSPSDTFTHPADWPTLPK